MKDKIAALRIMPSFDKISPHLNASSGTEENDFRIENKAVT